MNRGNTKDNPELLTNNQQAEEIINRYSDGSIMHSDSSIKELGQSVCGNFYYGISIRYNGEILSNCHAYETAGLIGNIRNISLRECLRKIREIREAYLERFWDGGFCPLRNPNFDDFVEFLRSQKGR